MTWSIPQPLSENVRGFRHEPFAEFRKRNHTTQFPK
jgi:hypothetical protein